MADPGGYGVTLLRGFICACQFEMSTDLPFRGPCPPPPLKKSWIRPGLYTFYCLEADLAVASSEMELYRVYKKTEQSLFSPNSYNSRIDMTNTCFKLTPFMSE